MGEGSNSSNFFLNFHIKLWVFKIIFHRINCFGQMPGHDMGMGPNFLCELLLFFSAVEVNSPYGIWHDVPSLRVYFSSSVK